MFQEAPDNGAHADIVGHAGNAGLQCAHAAHDEVDLDPGGGGLVERRDRRRLEQRVHLGDDAALLAVLGVLHFVLDRAQDLLVQRKWGLPEVLQLGCLAKACQLDKNVVDVDADLLVCREQAEIGIELGRARMVVPGRKMHIASQAIVLAPYHEQHLGVRLVAHHAVDHMRPDLLETLRPVDVGLLVEAREQLENDGHFLSAARGRDQDVHQFGLGAGAVDGHLDRHDRRVASRLLEQDNDRLEGLEWMIEQDVRLPDRCENVRMLLELRRHSRPKYRVFEIGARDPVRYAHQAHEVDRAVHAIEVLLAQAELREQELGDLRRTVVGHLKPHLVAKLAVRQLAAQRGAQVLDLFLVHEQLAVARDAELVAVDHLHAGEELPDVLVKDRGQEDEIVLGSRDLPRQPDDARQHARRLHDRDARIAPEGILALELNGKIEALV